MADRLVELNEGRPRPCLYGLKYFSNRQSMATRFIILWALSSDRVRFSSLDGDMKVMIKK